MSFPKLIVFDFHKTLSLDKMELNTLLKQSKEEYRQNVQPKGKLTEDSWYQIFKRNNIDINQIMPTWKDIIQFIKYIKNSRPDVIFAIASMIENDLLILGMMKYVFEKLNMINPFTSDTVVATFTFNKYGYMNLPGKQQHIMVITTNLGLQDTILIKDTVLIDDSYDNIKNTEPICGVLATDYFQISDWNKSQQKPNVRNKSQQNLNSKIIYCNYPQVPI